jgi:hypothetical protein
VTPRAAVRETRRAHGSTPVALPSTGAIAVTAPQTAPASKVRKHEQESVLD